MIGSFDSTIINCIIIELSGMLLLCSERLTFHGKLMSGWSNI